LAELEVAMSEGESNVGLLKDTAGALNSGTVDVQTSDIPSKFWDAPPYLCNNSAQPRGGSASDSQCRE
jgi:hypothetical protein